MYKDINPVGLRLPAELKAKVVKSAADRHRSINAELVARVQESFERTGALKEFTDGELIDELVRRWGRENVLIQLGKKQK